MGLWIRAAFGNNEARTPGANARGVTHAFASIDSSDVGRGCLDAGQHQCARAAAFPGARASQDESASPGGSIAIPGCAVSDWQGCIRHKSGWMTLGERVPSLQMSRRFLEYIGMAPTRPS